MVNLLAAQAIVYRLTVSCVALHCVLEMCGVDRAECLYACAAGAGSVCRLATIYHTSLAE